MLLGEEGFFLFFTFLVLLSGAAIGGLIVLLVVVVVCAGRPRYCIVVYFCVQRTPSIATEGVVC